jgi:hypothetical protein
MSGAMAWQQEQCFAKSGRRYCLLHPAALAQAGKVRIPPLDREDGTRPFLGRESSSSETSHCSKTGRRLLCPVAY